MAYFSNSSDGMWFDEQCDECLHRDPDVMCPIAWVQMEFNYSQVGNPDIACLLNCLVGEDGKCKMKPLIDKYIPKDIQLDLFGMEVV